MDTEVSSRGAQDALTASIGMERLSRKLAVLGHNILHVANSFARPERSVTSTPGAAHQDELHGMMAEHLYFDRRRREMYFKPSLFGEPAWDLLLDLFVAGKNGRDVSVLTACGSAAAASTSTALRWINYLENDGLLERRRDTLDARRHHVTLTELGMRRMSAYLADVPFNGSDTPGSGEPDQAASA